MPPRSLMFDGSPNPKVYRSNGLEFLEHFKTLGGLEPTERVVDIGSGIGRKAVPLASYLTTGRYDGFEPVRVGVDWCTRHVTSRYPNFRFHWLDIHNGQYNPGGRLRPSEVRFDTPDATADFVILSSVFTHMLPSDVDHYLCEIARMLAPGGRAFLTWFLLQAAEGPPHALAPRFGPSDGTMAVENPAVPEQAIAYEPEWVMARLADHGLRVEEHRPGSWNGRAGTSLQDILVVTP